MRARPALPMFLAVLAACAPLRHVTPPAAPSAPLVPSPPPARPDDLGVLDHASVDAWEERLRADPRLRQQTAESLARVQRYLPGLRKILEENGVPPARAASPRRPPGPPPAASPCPASPPSSAWRGSASPRRSAARSSAAGPPLPGRRRKALAVLGRHRLERAEAGSQGVMHVGG